MQLGRWFVASLFVSTFFVGCSTKKTIERCYELVEGDTVNTIILRQSEPPTITIVETVNGELVAPELSTLGTLTATSFTYADGTTLALTETTLTWPEDSLLPGAVFVRTTCP